jgi:hypothetical protein
MFDPNMQIGLSLGRALALQPLELPTALTDINRRAGFIAQLDKPLLVDIDGVAQWVEFGEHLGAIAELSAGVMPEVPAELDRVSIALRLWAGCIMAAKAIAFETRSGANTTSGRTQEFTVIDQWAGEDRLFRAGVEAAPAFKTGREQKYSLDGVPTDSSVRRYVQQSSI